MKARLLQFWQKSVVGLFVAQLRQGVSPRKLALTIALGVCVSAFPIVGVTSIMCFVLGLLMGLNQPIIQFVNWLASPLQMGLLLAFVRLGERLVHAPHLPFSISQLSATFHASPARFFHEFGLVALHSIIGWAAVAPVAGLLLYFLFLTVARRTIVLPSEAAPITC